MVRLLPRLDCLTASFLRAQTIVYQLTSQLNQGSLRFTAAPPSCNSFSSDQSLAPVRCSSTIGSLPLRRVFTFAAFDYCRWNRKGLTGLSLIDLDLSQESPQKLMCQFHRPRVSQCSLFDYAENFWWDQQVFYWNKFVLTESSGKVAYLFIYLWVHQDHHYHPFLPI